MEVEVGGRMKEEKGLVEVERRRRWKWVLVVVEDERR